MKTSSERFWKETVCKLFPQAKDIRGVRKFMVMGEVEQVVTLTVELLPDVDGTPCFKTYTFSEEEEG